MPRPFNARTNRRDDGSHLMFIKDLSATTKDHLPETLFADDHKALSKDPWGTMACCRFRGHGVRFA